jgi:hypothetical protein
LPGRLRRGGAEFEQFDVGALLDLRFAAARRLQPGDLLGDLRVVEDERAGGRVLLGLMLGERERGAGDEHQAEHDDRRAAAQDREHLLEAECLLVVVGAHWCPSCGQRCVYVGRDRSRGVRQPPADDPTAQPGNRIRAGAYETKPYDIWRVEAAARRAKRPFDAETVLASARRAGAQAQAAAGRSVGARASSDRFVEASRRIALAFQRPPANRPRDPGAVLIDLLGFADAVAVSQPPRPFEPLAFPALGRLVQQRRGAAGPRGT